MGTLTLNDGRKGNAVLVGARQNPKGAAVVLPGEGGGPPKTVLLSEALHMLHLQQLADLLCMQERAFGDAGLPSPAELDA